MSPTLLEGPELAPASGKVKRLVVFLHGVGADGHDLLGLARMMDLPDTQFFSPHAPFPYDMAPFGHQWFSLMDRRPAPMLAGIEAAAPILTASLEAQMQRFGLTAKDVALVGFSQGAMMSLYAAPRMEEPVAGVVAMSGALLGGDGLATELKAKPPVCLIHGARDEVVPFAAMGLANTTLASYGIPVEAHPQPHLGHGIDEAAVGIVEQFLRRVFTL